MSGNVQYSNGRKYYQYRCSNKCGCKSVRTERLENAVFSVLTEALFSAPNQKKVLSKMNDIACSDKLENEKIFQRLRAKQSGLETAEKNLIDAIETGKATTVIMNRLDRISKEREQIAEKLKNVSNTIRNYTSNDLKFLKNKFSEYMIQCSSINARQLISFVIESVKVGNDTITVTLKEGIAVTRKFKEYVAEPLKDYTITLFLHDVYMDSMRHKLKCWFGQQGCDKLLPVFVPTQKIEKIFGDDVEKMIGKFFDVSVMLNDDNQLRKIVKLEAC